MKIASPRRAVTAGLLLALLGTPLAGGVRASFSLAPAAAAASRPGAGGFSLAAPAEAQAAAAPAVPPEAKGMPKKTKRAVIELGLLATYSTLTYWASYREWVEDWQYELTCADQYKRFLTTEAIRFDSNAYHVNWTHVQAGSFYYQLARTNYLTWAESTLATFASSLFYEYVSEWREVISVNDMIVTTFGGEALGEAWFQLGDYFHHQKSKTLRALGFINPFNEMNQYIDRKNPASHVYPAAGWHEFALSAGWRGTSETGRGSFDTGYLSFDSQIVRPSSYGRPGVFRKTLRDTSMSELSLEVALRDRPQGEEHLNDGYAEEWDLTTRIVGLAWYRQNIDQLGRGHALSFGLGSALTYLRKRAVLYDSRSVQVKLDPLPETPTDFRDKMTVAHIIGPVLDWTRFGRGLRFRLVADAYLDFAQMGSFAFNAYSAAQPIEGMKTTLNYYGYHYAYGASTSVRVDLFWGNLWLRGLASAHIWDSWDGLDRFQDELTNDVSAADSRTRYLVKAGWTIPSISVRAFVALEGIHRWGEIGDITAASQETRTFAGVSYLF